MPITASRTVPGANAFAVDPNSSFGLSLRVLGGHLIGGAAWQSVPNAGLTLADNATNYVQVSPYAVIESNTSGFTAGAVFLYIVTTASGVVTAIEDWRANPGVSAPNGVPVLQATVTLTDDQIKALPTAAVELVPAPGDGKAIAPLAAIVAIDTTAGAYTADADASLSLMADTAQVSGAGLTGAVLASAAKSMVQLPSNAAAGTGTFAGVATLAAAATPENVALSVKDVVGGVANYTGGDAANTLTVTVLYAVVDV